MTNKNPTKFNRKGRKRICIDLPDYIYDVLKEQSSTRRCTKTKLVVRALVYYFQHYFISDIHR